MTNHPNRAPRGAPPPALIIELRDQACITQSHAARLCRAGLRTWQHWEAGTRKMPLAAMELFCMALARGYIVPADEWMAQWVRQDFLPFYGCYCDRARIGVPGVSCGDCPRDYTPK